MIGNVLGAAAAACCWTASKEFEKGLPPRPGMTLKRSDWEDRGGAAKTLDRRRLFTVVAGRNVPR